MYWSAFFATPSTVTTACLEHPAIDEPSSVVPRSGHGNVCPTDGQTATLSPAVSLSQFVKSDSLSDTSLIGRRKSGSAEESSTEYAVDVQPNDGAGLVADPAAYRTISRHGGRYTPTRSGAVVLPTLVDDVQFTVGSDPRVAGLIGLGAGLAGPAGATGLPAPAVGPGGQPKPRRKFTAHPVLLTDDMMAASSRQDVKDAKDAPRTTSTGKPPLHRWQKSDSGGNLQRLDRAGESHDVRIRRIQTSEIGPSTTLTTWVTTVRRVGPIVGCYSLTNPA